MPLNNGLYSRIININKIIIDSLNIQILEKCLKIISTTAAKKVFVQYDKNCIWSISEYY